MARFELSISPNYVKHWGLQEAIREIFQNAIDQESIDDSNTMSYNYDEEETLSISSKSSVLDKSSLLFGNSSKENDKTTIGQFGEGYKLALLVLVRSGYKVTIYNYKLKETWTPKFINSRRFNSKLLVIDVSKHIFTKTPNSNLTFEIKGITKQDFNDIKSRCLFMQSEYNELSSKFGNVLLEKEHSRQVYINSLYVCTFKENELKFGYNIKPEYLSLDRDRSVVKSFDLIWLTSKIMVSLPDIAFVAKLILNGVPDIAYIDSQSINTELNDKSFDLFVDTYGINAIPISSSDCLQTIQQTYPKLKPVITRTETASFIRRSKNYIDMISFNKAICIKTPTDIITKIIYDLDPEVTYDDIVDILNKLNDESFNWRIK